MVLILFSLLYVSVLCEAWLVAGSGLAGAEERGGQQSSRMMNN